MVDTMQEFPIFTFHRNTSSSAIPDEIWRVPEPPKTLYIQGRLEALDLLNDLPQSGLAIVGTRTPQPRSKVFLTQEVKVLEGSSLVILSGLARGIDATAHEAALRARLKTIAVVGAGIEVDYPQVNADLRKSILHAGGLIISEYPGQMPAQGFQFIKRNRLIAGWAQATWVVEAGIRSGALNTARWARECDRTCFALPSFPGDPAFAGNQTLIDRDHAIPYWGVHSLGATWLELISHRERQDLKPLTLDEKRLLFQIRRSCSEKGGIRVQDLLSSSFDQGWSSERFFKTLGGLLAQRRILETEGVILSA